jgi:hypothetical protein
MYSTRDSTSCFKETIFCCCWAIRFSTSGPRSFLSKLSTTLECLVMSFSCISLSFAIKSSTCITKQTVTKMEHLHLMTSIRFELLELWQDTVLSGHYFLASTNNKPLAISDKTGEMTVEMSTTVSALSIAP